MSRHRLFLDSPTQVGKNRITLPPALANYYGNTATAYVNGRQVESKTTLTDAETFITFDRVDGSTFIDEQGNNNATNHGGTIVTGKYGNAISTDGVDDCVEFENTCEDASFSIAAWCKAWDSDVMIFSDFTRAPVYYYGKYLRIISNKVNVSTLNNCGNGTGQILASSTTLNSSNWTHLVFTHDAGESKIYINGSLDCSGTKTPVGYYSSHDKPTIGCESIGFYYGSVTVDDLFYFNRVVSSDEVSDLYNNQLERHLTFTTPTPVREIEIGRGNLELTDTSGANEVGVLHWTPSSDSGYYWVLTEDEIGNTVYLKHEGTWVEGQLFIKVDGSWKQASDINVKSSGTWK